jgi:NADPH2:quinone reductase
MTAFEALFEYAGLSLLEGGDVQTKRENENEKKEVLITGASGGVGIYLVQLAAASAGLRVVAASSSNTRNGEFLRELGADEVIEYSALEGVKDRFDVIIDTVGGETLTRCWGYIKDGGSLISVDSGSFNFMEEHGKRGIVRDGVKALFFIVRGSSRALHALAELVDRGMLKAFVAGRYPIAEVREAYDFANGRFTGRGKVILTV